MTKAAEQHNNHVTRQKYTAHVAGMRAVLDTGCYPCPDAYYSAKDRERELAAELTGKKSGQHDPMYFWHGGMSN